MVGERVVFSHRFGDVDDERLWRALQCAVPRRRIGAIDEARRTLEFRTSVSLTSWGEHMRASVSPAADGAELLVRGRPRSWFLTTTWGEDLHARGVERRLIRAIQASLGAT